MRRVQVISALVLCVAALGFGQNNLSTQIQQVGSTIGQAYLQPLGNAFGADINSGFFQSAAIQDGFHLYIGAKVMGAQIPDADRTMNISYNDQNAVFPGYSGPASVVASGPTVFGNQNTKGVATITYKNNLGTHVLTDSTIAGVTNISIAPLVMPQIGIGTIFGTDFVGRYFPKTSIGNYGSIGFWGFGVRHSISQYLHGASPVDIAVQLGWQGLTIQDSLGNNLISTKSFLANVEASKTFAILTIYGALQKESSTMDVSYTFTSNGISLPIAFSLDEKNTFRGVIGASLSLGPILINADYDAGSTTIFSGGLGLSF
jgi:hypothetical protein